MKKVYLILIAAAICIFTLTSSGKDVIFQATINDKKQIALTFDDGPHPYRTPQILDILEKYDIKATFFLIGKNVEYYPDVVSREISLGHEIGNHTYSHAQLSKLTEDKINEELSAFENALSKVSDYHASIIRPPCGCYSEALCTAANESNYKIILWSIDTKDWAHTPVDKIVENILTKVKSGDIILMHDYIAGDSPTPKVLEIIIPRLLDEGYEFVTVSELIK